MMVGIGDIFWMVGTVHCIEGARIFGVNLWLVVTPSVITYLGLKFSICITSAVNAILEEKENFVKIKRVSDQT